MHSKAPKEKLDTQAGPVSQVHPADGDQLVTKASRDSAVNKECQDQTASLAWWGFRENPAT